MTGWRFVAQRAVTRELLDLELPLDLDELGWGLTAAGSLRGKLEPDVGQVRASDGRLLLEEWGTLLYAEADGLIRWGGILTKSGFAGAEWQLEAQEFSTYLHGTPFLGSWGGSVSSPQVDPLDAVRAIWAHTQSFPAGALGMTVDGTSSPIRLGTLAAPAAGSTPAQDAQPYRLDWWEAKDCGQELDQLAGETPFDYREEHAWNAAGTDVTHRFVLGYPRLGTRRTDLAFVQGINVTNVVPVDRDGSDYANGVLAVGAGEGAQSLRVSVAAVDGRLRRVATYTDKAAKRTAQLQTAARQVLRSRQGLVELSSVDVVDHEYASIGAWQLGDDVLVEAELPWLGLVREWHRVVGWSLLSDSRARLQLARSDSFTYGGTVGTAG